MLASTPSVMAGAVVAPVLRPVRTGLVVSATAAGAVPTALVVAVTSPTIGTPVDRYGVRRPLAAGLLVVVDPARGNVRAAQGRRSPDSSTSA